MKTLLCSIFCSWIVMIYGQLNGEWHTSFVVMGTSLRLDMKIEGYPNKTKIFVSDPDAGKKNETEMDNLVISDEIISYTWTSINLSFNGKYYANGDSISGKMNQSGIEWNATFTHDIQELVKVTRPQEPKEPFPYTIKEVKVKNGDVELTGTLTIPNTSSNYPIVILASGTGPQNRDCEILGHKPFWVIADYLTRNNIAVLRFDDRGTGKSTGSYANASIDDFGSDVRALSNYLNKNPEYRDHPLGLVGHSEGGMHVLLAAKKNKNVDFIIELASVGTNGRQVLVEQQYLIPLKSGENEATAKWNSSVFDGLSEIIMKYPKEEAVEPISNFLDSMYQIAPESYKEISNLMNFKLGLLMFMNNDWARGFVKFETKDYISRLKIPVLTINGSEDVQVPGVRNKEAFEMSISEKSKPYSKSVVLEGVNHLFQHCNTCRVEEYADLEETFAVEAMQIMVDWIEGLKL